MEPIDQHDAQRLSTCVNQVNTFCISGTVPTYGTAHVPAYGTAY